MQPCTEFWPIEFGLYSYSHFLAWPLTLWNDPLSQCSQVRGWFLPSYSTQELLITCGDILIVTTGRMLLASNGVEVRDTAEHITMHKTAYKNMIQPKMSILLRLGNPALSSFLLCLLPWFRMSTIGFREPKSWPHLQIRRLGLWITVQWPALNPVGLWLEKGKKLSPCYVIEIWGLLVKPLKRKKKKLWLL